MTLDDLKTELERRGWASSMVTEDPGVLSEVMIRNNVRVCIVSRTSEWHLFVPNGEPLEVGGDVHQPMRRVASNESEDVVVAARLDELDGEKPA